MIEAIAPGVVGDAGPTSAGRDRLCIVAPHAPVSARGFARRAVVPTPGLIVWGSFWWRLASIRPWFRPMRWAAIMPTCLTPCWSRLVATVW